MRRQHKGENTKVKVGARLSEEVGANVRVHQGSVLSPLLFTIVSYVATNEIKNRTFQEIL